MAESTKKKNERAKVAAVPDVGDPQGSPKESANESQSCPVAFCPICTAVNLIQPLNPDVVEHLLNAGREFLLAAKVGLDAIAGDAGDKGDVTLEKIDIG